MSHALNFANNFLATNKNYVSKLIPSVCAIPKGLG
jgi:hypothetical protein